MIILQPMVLLDINMLLLGGSTNTIPESSPETNSAPTGVFGEKPTTAMPAPPGLVPIKLAINVSADTVVNLLEGLIVPIPTFP